MAQRDTRRTRPDIRSVLRNGFGAYSSFVEAFQRGQEGNEGTVNGVLAVASGNKNDLIILGERVKWWNKIVHKMTEGKDAPKGIAKSNDKTLMLNELDNISWKLFQLNERLRDESVGQKIKKGFWE